VAPLKPRELGLVHQKEKSMKKFLFTLLVLGVSTIALVGCKAEGEVGDDVHTSVPALR